jgi:hypothetical protein
MLSNPIEVEFLTRLYSAYPNIISGPDAYNFSPDIEVGAYDDYWDEQRALGRNEIKTLWQVTSAHTQDEVYFERDLTYDDIYYQTIAGIVAGAMGVAYYDSPWGCDLQGCEIPAQQNGIVNSFAQNFEHLRQVNSQLDVFESALLGTELFQRQFSNVNLRAFEDAYRSGRRWLFMSNPQTREVGVEVYE